MICACSQLIVRLIPRISAPLALVTMFSLTIGTLISAPPAAAAAFSNQYYVAETGHTFSDPFLTRWVEMDGQNTLGLPVSEPIVRSKASTQYFEFGVLTGSKNVKSAKEIKAVEVGAELIALQHDPMRLVTGRRVGSGRETAAFTPRTKPSNAKVKFEEKTGHQISGQMLGAYKKFGGAKVLGRPLSDAYDSAGKRSQWFEFGRLETGSKNRDASFGATGLELAVARGIDINEVHANGLLAFNADRFRRFLGDGTIPEANGPFSPVEIKIPAISVDAKIEQVGIDNGVMGIPADPWNVAWYPTISEPGTYTNVVMAGHKDWWNVGPTVFWNLNQLVPDEKIYLVGADGTGGTYQITKSYAVDANVNAQEIVSDHGSEMVTLITCDGAFDGEHYLQRWIVIAERI